MRVLLGVILFYGVSIAGVGTAVADAPPPPQQQGFHQRPCAQDVQRFCDKVPFGQGRRLACLASHKKELHPACVTSLKDMQDVFAAAQENLKKIHAKEAARDKAEKNEKPAGPAAKTPKPNLKPKN